MPANADLAFCGACGTRLELRHLDGRRRGACPGCGWIHYEQLKVGAGVLVISRGKVLLARRNIEPFEGCWGLPAGYVEGDESPESAARREAREEVGIEASIHALAGVYFFDDDPRGNGILIVYECSAEGEPRASEETSGVAYFSPGDVPAELAGAGHREAVLDWIGRAS